jgi:hypothetical protein
MDLSMSNVLGTPAAMPAPLVERTTESQVDYCSRALVLWPRLERDRLARARNDPARVAALISHRTTLSLGAIMELLGVPAPERSHAARRPREATRGN